MKKNNTNIVVLGKFFDSQEKAEKYVSKKPNPKAFVIVEFGIETRLVLPANVLNKKR